MRRRERALPRPRASWPGAVLLIAALGIGALPGSAATSNVVVSMSVPSATQLSTTACATGAAATSFGVVLPGTPAVTSADCTISFGSSNDTSMLRVWQGDRFGTAMWSPPTGGMDNAFGSSGTATWDVPGGGTVDVGLWHGIAATRDGTEDVYAMGADGSNTVVIARFTSTGALQTTWSAGDGTNGYATFTTSAGGSNSGAIAVDDAGYVYMTSFNGSSESSTVTAKLTPTGAPDTSWGPSGIRDLNLCDPNGASNAEWTFGLVPRADGGMYVSGTCSLSVTDSQWFAASIGPTGSIDTTFGTGGLWSHDPSTNWDEVGEMVQDPSTGDLLIAGITYPSGSAAATIARLTTSGVPRASFVGDGTDVAAGVGIVGYRQAGGGIEHDVNTISLDGAGKATIAGRLSSWSTATRNLSLLRIDATTGARDLPYGTNGWAVHDLAPGLEDGATSVLAMADGSSYVAGYIAVGAQVDTFLARLTNTGTLDTGFGSSGLVVKEVVAGRNNHPNGMAVIGDGDLVVQGTASQAAGDDTMALYRFEGAKVDDYVDAGGGTDRDWSSSSTTSMFGMCLRALGGAAAASAFTVDGGSDCGSTDADEWYGVPATAGAGSKLATSAGTVTTGTASLRFGLRPATTQRPGAYFAPISFEVLAPNA